jgi:hypothetical protein
MSDGVSVLPVKLRKILGVSNLQTFNSKVNFTLDRAWVFSLLSKGECEGDLRNGPAVINPLKIAAFGF